jgi:hypothetical protein
MVCRFVKRSDRKGLLSAPSFLILEGLFESYILEWSLMGPDSYKLLDESLTM